MIKETVVVWIVYSTLYLHYNI